MSRFSSESAGIQEIGDHYKNIVEASKEPSGPGDMAIIFSFMKMLDPESVVRESEYAAALKAAGWLDKARNDMVRFANGEKLRYTRHQYLEIAKKLYASRYRTQQKMEVEYRGIAEAHGIPDKYWLIDYKEPEFLKLSFEKPKETGQVKKGKRKVSRKNWSPKQEDRLKELEVLEAEGE